MTLSPDALDEYFNRIDYRDKPANDVPTLQQLHNLHPRRIAFENLDAWLGRAVVLDADGIYEKLISQRRGGYCFEHNLLFRQVLETLGFSVRGLSARVLWNQPDNRLLPRTHMLLLVTLDNERYIADVGFGGLTLTGALHLDTDQVQRTSHEEFRIVRDRDEYVLQSRSADIWQPLYRFSLEEQQLADYEMANWFVSTHPQSRFVAELIAGRVDAGVRHVLLNKRYTQHFTDRPSVVTMLESPRELRELLENTMAIDGKRLPTLDAGLAKLFQEQSSRKA